MKFQLPHQTVSSSQFINWFAMAFHRKPKEEALGLKPPGVTSTVSNVALISKVIDNPISQHITAGYFELKPGSESTGMSKLKVVL